MHEVMIFCLDFSVFVISTSLPFFLVDHCLSSRQWIICSLIPFFLSPLPIGDALLMANVLAGDAGYGPPFHHLHSIPLLLFGIVQ